MDIDPKLDKQEDKALSRKFSHEDAAATAWFRANEESRAGNLAAAKAYGAEAREHEALARQADEELRAIRSGIR